MHHLSACVHVCMCVKTRAQGAHPRCQRLQSETCITQGVYVCACTQGAGACRERDALHKGGYGGVRACVHVCARGCVRVVWACMAHSFPLCMYVSVQTHVSAIRAIFVGLNQHNLEAWGEVTTEEEAWVTAGTPGTYALEFLSKGALCDRK